MAAALPEISAADRMEEHWLALCRIFELEKRAPQ
jgi:hypothetical protein